MSESRITVTWKNAAGDTGESSISNEALVRVEAAPVPQFGDGLHQVTFTYKNGFSKKFNVEAAEAERINTWAQTALIAAYTTASGLTFEHCIAGGTMAVAETKYAGLQSVSAAPGQAGTYEVVFTYDPVDEVRGVVRTFIVRSKAFEFIRVFLKRDLGMDITIADTPAIPTTRGATCSLFADIVGRLFGADEANNMHREFAIWSDNLDKIIETSIKAHAAPDRFVVVDDGQQRNPEVAKMVARSTANSTGLTMFPRNIRFASDRIVPAAPTAPPTRYIRDDKKPEFPSVIDRMRKQMQAEANTVRELLVDLISHSTHVREALQLRLKKAEEDDATDACESVEMLGANESFWTHELEKHDMMVVDARRLLQVIP